MSLVCVYCGEGGGTDRGTEISTVLSQGSGRKRWKSSQQPIVLNSPNVYRKYWTACRSSLRYVSGDGAVSRGY
jgi:hypothetical protein